MRNSRQWGRMLVGLGLALAVATLSVAPADAGRAARTASWGPVRNLSAPAPSWNLIPTSVAVDARGNALALWVHTGEGRSPVMSAFRPSGRAWRAPVPVPGSRGAHEQARVGFDGAGGAVVAWVSGRRVGTVRRAPGGTWTKPLTVYRSAAGVERALPAGLDLAVNERGRSVLTWDSRGVKAVTGFEDGTWGKVRTVGRGGGGDVVIDRWGRATVVWGLGGWTGRVMTASRDVGRPWTKPRPLTRSLFFYEAEVAVRHDGEVAVLVHPPVRHKAGLQILRKPRNGPWSRTAPLAQGGDAWKHRMGMDDSGRIAVAWLNLGTGALWRVDYAPGRGWTRKVRVTRPGTAGDDYWLAVNGGGDALLGWTSRPGRHAVQAVYRSRSGGWQARPRTLSQGTGQSRGPALAIGARGTAVMVWTFQHLGSTQSRVQASSFTR